jgi:hypothetical protein
MSSKHPYHTYKTFSLKDAQLKVASLWCEENGYTETFWAEGRLWAFPKGGVMPIQLLDVIPECAQPSWILLNNRLYCLILPSGVLIKVSTVNPSVPAHVPS